MSKKNLYILAPNDRFNYGDLLFSKILEQYFKNSVDNIYLCSTTQADLTARGGDKVAEERILLSASPKDDNYLIIAGGESLMADWLVILSYVKPSAHRLNRIIGKISLNPKIRNRSKAHFADVKIDQIVKFSDSGAKMPMRCPHFVAHSLYLPLTPKKHFRAYAMMSGDVVSLSEV